MVLLFTSCKITNVTSSLSYVNVYLIATKIATNNTYIQWGIIVTMAYRKQSVRHKNFTDRIVCRLHHDFDYKLFAMIKHVLIDVLNTDMKVTSFSH